MEGKLPEVMRLKVEAEKTTNDKSPCVPDDESAAKLQVLTILNKK